MGCLRWKEIIVRFGFVRAFLEALKMPQSVRMRKISAKKLAFLA